MMATGSPASHCRMPLAVSLGGQVAGVDRLDRREALEQHVSRDRRSARIQAVGEFVVKLLIGQRA